MHKDMHTHVLRKVPKKSTEKHKQKLAIPLSTKSMDLDAVFRAHTIYPYTYKHTHTHGHIKKQNKN